MKQMIFKFWTPYPEGQKISGLYWIKLNGKGEKRKRPTFIGGAFLFFTIPNYEGTYFIGEKMK
ncbi:hypothetical protein Barb4_04815 [Bacteroidales bacterium Barb4]|nr:hypothetical protein Barb4_04815 [Bacteroidales bacterium Barb4]